MKNLQNTIDFRFVLAIYFWAWGLPLAVVCTTSETLLEKTNFSFASGYELEIASVLEYEVLSISHLGIGTPSAHTLTGSASILLDPEGLFSLPSSTPLALPVSASSSTEIPEPLRGEI